MRITDEDRRRIRDSIHDDEMEKQESYLRVKDAADQMLTTSSQLRLTWDEFERAVALVQKLARISQV